MAHHDVRQIQTSARIAQMIFERLGTALDHRPTASGYGPHATPIPVRWGETQISGSESPFYSENALGIETHLA